MIDRKEIKSIAKQKLKGKALKIGVPYVIATALLNAIYLFIFGVDPELTRASLIGQIILTVTSSLVGFGAITGALRASEGKEIPRWIDCMTWDLDKFAKYMIFTLFYVFAVNVGLFILVIPGILISLIFMFGQYLIVLKDYDVLEAFTGSKELTKGRLKELFVLNLSFLGWAILSSVTFGIANIFVRPYMDVVFIEYIKRLESCK